MRLETRQTVRHFVQMSGTMLSQSEGHLAEVLWRHKARADKYHKFFQLLPSVYLLQAPPQYSYPTPLFSTSTVGESAEDLNRSVVVPATDDMVEEDGPDKPGDDVETAFEEVCKIVFIAVVFTRHCISLSQSNILFIPSVPCPSVTYIYIFRPMPKWGVTDIYLVSDKLFLIQNVRGFSMQVQLITSLVPLQNPAFSLGLSVTGGFEERESTITRCNCHKR